MPVIEVRNLYKKFTIETGPVTMYHLFRRMLGMKKHRKEIWALKDINLSIERGDRVGLIGSNGSGKSTLLRIIADVYKSTQGTVSVKGEMSAFLQLGIGMERNLTALENIFLFGVIMGLERNEIKQKLTDIVEFAEIEDFLYCPLRDFSSGMVQRLAFSIAMHLKSDILILDEILASGDIGFKEKSYEFFESHVKNSKTIIFTSHELEIIKKFCNKILLLDKGNQIAFGAPEVVLDIYHKKELHK